MEYQSTRTLCVGDPVQFLKADPDDVLIPIVALVTAVVPFTADDEDKFLIDIVWVRDEFALGIGYEGHTSGPSYDPTGQAPNSWKELLPY